MSTTFAGEQCLDIDFETARALHRIVRGMHDGECPKCHTLHFSDQMPVPDIDPDDKDFALECPTCQFRISAKQKRAAFAAFAPVMDKNLAIFEGWRERSGLN